MPVICPYCSREFKGDKLSSRHLSKCNPSLKVPVPPCLCGHESTSLTQMKRHRRKCDVWKNRDKRALAQKRREETLLERHGVTNPRHIEEAEEKRKETLLEKYGAENVFSRESTVFEKVQESLEGKRPVLKGQDNPFAWESTKEKIKETMLEKYGVENPQQDPEIRSRTRETNLDRYGVEETLASPEIRERIRETCEEVYGGPAPSCSPEVLAKAQETNLERYGVPWTCMDPEVRRKQLETMEANYGSHFFASEEGIQKVREGMLVKYGVDHPAKVDGFWERQVEKFLERYGVSHPLQLAEFLEKRRETCQERYGVDSPLQSPEVMAKWITTSMRNWGAPHPMQNREYARKHLERMSRPGPNRLEQRVASMAPSMLFTGDGSFWKWLPKLGHHKNPDFILPGPHPDNPKKGVTKVVEVFGDFWHSKMFTGKAPFEHEQELIEAFAEIGISCLVLWESEVKSNPAEVSERLATFLEVEMQQVFVALSDITIGNEIVVPKGTKAPVQGGRVAFKRESVEIHSLPPTALPVYGLDSFSQEDYTLVTSHIG